MTEGKEKRGKPTEWVQVKVTIKEKEFLKNHIGNQTEFVLNAIRAAAKEKGVALPA